MINSDSFQNTISDLGRPYFRCANVALYHGDASEYLDRIPDGAVDLCVTSPPYNIGKEYEIVLTIDDYLSWCSSWMTKLFMKTSPHGAFWLNVGYTQLAGRAKAIPLPYLLWDKSPFYLMQEIVWRYGAGVACKHQFSPRNEKFLWFVKNSEDYIFNLDLIRDKNVKYPNQKKHGKLRCNPLGKNPTDVWDIPKVTSGKDRSSKERTDHPAQFPLATIDRVIKASSIEGNLILDPFMGSGTTAVAALELGRCVVGFEKESRYLDIAAKRIEQSLLPKVDQTELGLAVGI